MWVYTFNLYILINTTAENIVVHLNCIGENFSIWICGTYFSEWTKSYWIKFLKHIVVHNIKYIFCDMTSIV